MLVSMSVPKRVNQTALRQRQSKITVVSRKVLDCLKSDDMQLSLNVSEFNFNCMEPSFAKHCAFIVPC